MRRKQRATRQELAENAPSGPHVRLRAVLGLAEEQLGRTVPERHHFGRVAILVAELQLASQAEIGQLDFVLVGQQKVRCLQVTVHDHVFVEIA